MEVAHPRLHQALAAPGAGTPRRLFVDMSALLHSAFYSASAALVELTRLAFVTAPDSEQYTITWNNVYKALYTGVGGVFPSFFSAMGQGAYHVEFFFEHGSSRFNCCHAFSFGCY
jgi:hypothetical protein